MGYMSGMAAPKSIVTNTTPRCSPYLAHYNKMQRIRDGRGWSQEKRNSVIRRSTGLETGGKAEKGEFGEWRAGPPALVSKLEHGALVSVVEFALRQALPLVAQLQAGSSG